MSFTTDAPISQQKRAAEKGPSGMLTRLLALGLPTMGAFGSALPVFGPFFAFRVATLILAVVALTYPTTRNPQRLNRPVVWLALLWVSVGSVLTLISLDPSAAIRTMTSVTLGLLLAVAGLRIMAAEPRFLGWLVNGWVISFLITGAIGVWEVQTGQHLANYYVDSSTSSALPAATFYNPNAFAIYLVGMQGLLLWKLSSSRGNIGRLFFLAATVLCLFLILSTGSRLCLGAAILLIVTFFLLDRLGILRAMFIVGLFMLTLTQLGPITTALEPYIPADVKNTTAGNVLLEFSDGDTSGGRRVELYKTAAWLTAATGGMGVGPGNFGIAVQTLHPPYDTGGTLSPHNFIGELASEFGVIVLGVLVLLLGSVVRRLLPLRGPERATVLATGVAFLLAGFANSGYLLASSMWALFATLLCFVLAAERKESVGG